MKTLLAILFILLMATLVLPAQELPPNPQDNPKAHEMQNAGRKARVTATTAANQVARRQADSPAPIAHSQPDQPYEHPEARRVRLQVEWNLAHPPRADRVTAASRNPARPALISPKASGEMRNRKMKPVLESTSDARQTQWP